MQLLNTPTHRVCQDPSLSSQDGRRMADAGRGDPLWGISPILFPGCAYSQGEWPLAFSSPAPLGGPGGRGTSWFRLDYQAAEGKS